MKNTALTVVSTFIITVVLVLGGCYGCSYYIGTRTGCEMYNIDNVELRACVDIPNIKNVVCNYDAAKKTKSNLFTLDLRPGKEISDYIGYNNLAKVQGNHIPQFVHQQQWNNEISKLPASGLYFKYGHYKTTRRMVVLDSTSQKLWIELTETNEL